MRAGKGEGTEEEGKPVELLGIGLNKVIDFLDRGI